VAKLQRKAGQYHHGRLKEALIGAGRALLEQRGLEGFTLRECARRARVSHAAPAYHFNSVADLLAEIAARGFDDLTAAMDASAADDSNPATRLMALGRGYVSFAVANQAVFQLMFNREARSETNEQLARAAKAAYTRLESGIGGVIPQCSPSVKQAMRDLAWAGVHGFAMLALGGQLGPCGPADPVFKHRLESLLQAIVNAIADGGGVSSARVAVVTGVDRNI
jgi:AcrR family transcriptional regulator